MMTLIVQILCNSREQKRIYIFGMTATCDISNTELKYKEEKNDCHDLESREEKEMKKRKIGEKSKELKLKGRKKKEIKRKKKERN